MSERMGSWSRIARAARGGLIVSGVVLLLFSLPVQAGSPAVERDTPAARPVSGTVRVGTFDTRGVALAWGRSERPDGLLAKVAELRREVAQAKEDGDEKRVKELEARGPVLQEQVHRQVFAGAPIPEILALLEDEFPEIARRAGVDLIVGDVLYAGPSAEVVDITLEVCAPFEPDGETREMIAELLKTPPVNEAELGNRD